MQKAGKTGWPGSVSQWQSVMKVVKSWICFEDRAKNKVYWKAGLWHEQKRGGGGDKYSFCDLTPVRLL